MESDLVTVVSSEVCAVIKCFKDADGNIPKRYRFGTLRLFVYPHKLIVCNPKAKLVE